VSSDPPVLGVDVGGTKVAVGALDGAGVREGIERPTDVTGTGPLLDGIEAAVREVMERAGRPVGVGIGVPSQIEYATGTVETSVNIPLTGVPLRDELGGRLGVPVFVDNDANVAALAEARLIEGPPAENLVMLTLGTGVGGGVVSGGMIFRGAHGLGAELGHFSINPDGPPCPGNCPNFGCLEAYCSGQALERDATELAQDLPDSRLHAAIGDDGKVSGPECVAAAEDGDPDALRVFERFGRMLGIGIAGYVNVFNPELVVVGGGLSAAGDLLLEPARRVVAEQALPPARDAVRIALAELGPDAGLIGSAVVAFEALDAVAV
jgi:glucokinase